MSLPRAGWVGLDDLLRSILMQSILRFCVICLAAAPISYLYFVIGQLKRCSVVLAFSGWNMHAGGWASVDKCSFFTG